VRGVAVSVRHRLAWLLLLVLLPAAAPDLRAGDDPAWLADLLARDRITVVVTDSGLGGLAVVADAAEKLRRHGVFEAVDLVFVNALFREQGGYNSLSTREQKLDVFDSALRAMAARYRPDLVLVACNTLSVLAPDTAFARAGGVPVVGIVDLGVEQIADRLLGKPAGRNILFATATTVEEGDHRDGLLELGVGEDQLLAQACPQLSFYIEQGFDAMDTELLIDAYVDEALERLGDTDGPLTVSFNCTHFGYALESWRLAFESRGVAVEAYLDPNSRMVDFLLPGASRQRHPGTTVTVKVVSMIPLADAAVDSIGRFLHGVSPATETALRDYQLAPGLFEWARYLETTE
jgi:glutamate racemase